jgi:hypothetical protein
MLWHARMSLDAEQVDTYVGSNIGNPRKQSHEIWTVSFLVRFALRWSSDLDLLLHPQPEWPAGAFGASVLLNETSSAAIGDF